jgi:hypothetical protein
MRVVMLTCALGLAACVGGSGTDSDKLSGQGGESEIGVGDGDDVDTGGAQEVCEVEPEGIGKVGTVPTHGDALRAVSWVQRRGDAGKYVGFDLSRKARFTVIVGTKEYQAEGRGWMHPDGDRGAAITAIDFCDDYCTDNGGDPNPQDPGDPGPGGEDPLPPVD